MNAEQSIILKIKSMKKFLFYVFACVACLVSCGKTGGDDAVPGEFYGNWQRFKYEYVFKGEPVVWKNLPPNDNRYIVEVDKNNNVTVYGALDWGTIKGNEIVNDGDNYAKIRKVSDEVAIYSDRKALPDDKDYKEYATFRGTQIYTYAREQFAYNENGKWYSIDKLPLKESTLLIEGVEKADDIDVEHECWSDCIIEYFEKVE